MAYYSRATVFLAMGKSKSALPDLSKVIELKPDFTSVRFSLQITACCMWKRLLMSCIPLQFTFHDDWRVGALLMEDKEACLVQIKARTFRRSVSETSFGSSHSHIVVGEIGTICMSSTAARGT